MSGRYKSEQDSVQNPIIRYVSEDSEEYLTESGERIFFNLGWDYISPQEALRLRGGKKGIILKDIFIDQIMKFNSFLTNDLVRELLKNIEKDIIPNIEGNLIFWRYLKGLKSLYIPSQKRELNITLIDTENIKNNTFQVTDEFEFTNGAKTIRQDIVFFINGIPLIFIETKAPDKLHGADEAITQIRRYHNDCPELLITEQVFALTHIIKFLYGATWNVSSKSLYNWKDEVKGNFETLVKAFFDKKRIIKLITDYILFVKKDDQLQKVILRPHQMRAVEKILERAEDKQKKRGLIWHTQGSGKTYTMIVSAKKLIENPIFENPTVIMLVDRNELESQLFNNITAVGIENVEVVQSKNHLERILREDRRGLIVSTIQKFENMPENINTRDNIFVLVDEAHRTTSGKLGSYMMGALPNATYIGFTGTPIDRTSYGQGTFVTFGKDDPPKGYLDRYNIAESIEDGATLPLHYSLAPNELRVDRDVLEKEFLELTEAQGISDIDELNSILEKAVTLKNIIKSKDRISKIAKYVVEHYKEYVEPLGYKAFLVAVDREACALYKEELDKLLCPEYSKVVFTPFYNDPPELSKYHMSEEEEKIVRKDFLNPQKLPKILIVTNKLLTGFDAPILYCMYLDKPMRDHTLLQSIARVNRPYEDGDGRKKPSGLIVDFIGIFENLEKALAFDSQDIEGIVNDISVLKERFSQLMKRAKEEFLKIIENKTEDKRVEAILEHFSNKEKRYDYYKFFEELSSIYDILSPDQFLRPYLEDMDTLARIYRILREAYEPTSNIDKDFSKKVEELVRKHTVQGVIKPALEVYEINELTLKKLEKSKASDREKVFNLTKSIEVLVNGQSGNSPYLISIGERAEDIIKRYKEEQISTQEALEELKKLIEEINRARQEQIQKNMNIDVFTAYWFFKKEKLEDPEELAREFEKLINEYPYWKVSEEQERGLKQKLIGIIINRSKNNYKKVLNIVQTLLYYLKRAS